MWGGDPRNLNPSRGGDPLWGGLRLNSLKAWLPCQGVSVKGGELCPLRPNSVRGGDLRRLRLNSCMKGDLDLRRLNSLGGEDPRRRKPGDRRDPTGGDKRRRSDGDDPLLRPSGGSGSDMRRVGELVVVVERGSFGSAVGSESRAAMLLGPAPFVGETRDVCWGGGVGVSSSVVSLSRVLIEKFASSISLSEAREGSRKLGENNRRPEKESLKQELLKLDTTQLQRPVWDERDLPSRMDNCSQCCGSSERPYLMPHAYK